MISPIIIAALIIAATLVLLLIVIFIKQNRQDSFGKVKRETSAAMQKGMSIGIAIGMGTGVALGSSLDNMGVGIAIGVGMGVSLGAAFGVAFKKKEDEERELNRGALLNSSERKNRLPVFLGFLAIIIGLLLLGLMVFMNTN